MKNKVRCENCMWEGLENEMGLPLSELENLGQRLEAGSVVPVGSCPLCSAFVYYADKTEEEENKMSKYIVTRKEIYEQGVMIDAESEEEAIEKVADGEGVEIGSLFEYNDTIDTDEWKVEKVKDE